VDLEAILSAVEAGFESDPGIVYGGEPIGVTPQLWHVSIRENARDEDTANMVFRPEAADAAGRALAARGLELGLTTFAALEGKATTKGGRKGGEPVIIVYARGW